MSNAERYLALMRLAVRYGSVEIKWGDYSDPGAKRKALEWSVMADDGEGIPRVIGMGRSLDAAVDEAARADDARPASVAP